MKVINIRKNDSSRGAIIRLEGLQGEICVTYSDGQLELLPPLDMDLLEFAKLIQHSFEGKNDILPKAEEYFEAKISSISFAFKGIGITVNAENSNWYNTIKAYTIGKEKAQYPDSFIVRLDEETEMLYKSKDAREVWMNTIGCTNYETILNVARRWAKLMQFYMKEEHRKLEDIVEESYKQAVLNEDSETTRLFATDALVLCWKYGTELKEYLSTKKDRTA